MSAPVRVEVSPSEVEAGAELSVRIRPGDAAPGGSPVSVRIEDEDGTTIANLTASAGDERTTSDDTVVVSAPLRPGTHRWQVVETTHAEDGDDRGTGVGSCSFTVRPHAVRVVVWDIPPTVDPGERFGITAGLACRVGCAPDGWTIEVRDAADTVRATGAPDDGLWPGTDALHAGTLDLTAPTREGLHEWTVSARVADGSSHVGATTRLGVRVVPPADCTLTVIAIDAETRAPLPGARVVRHPYRAVTDTNGRAELRVPRGPYRLFVSAPGRTPVRHEGELTRDDTIHAELETEPELSDAEIWS